MRKEEFNSIVFSPMMRTNEVKRYSGTRLQEEETLAQHITDMCMMSYIVVSKLNSLGENLDLGLTLEKCLIHDIDELGTGDMPRNTKYANPRIKKEMDEVGKLVVERYAKVHPGMDSILTLWETAKDGKEGFVVKLCDMLCVVRKAVIEIEIYNNLSCLKVTKELSTHLNKMSRSMEEENKFDNEKSKEFLIELLQQSETIVSDINARYGYTASQYNITKNILEEEDY